MTEGASGRLVLTAMIFAVAMTFIDQTIVALAVPELQKDLSLSSTGVQWIVNAYLLSLSALFAFGGRLADIAGHRRMVVIGVVLFAGSSALCGATPTGDLAEPWLLTFRVLQGAGAALMFPAALAIVVAAFPVSARGRAMATFFGITGALTALGPLAGGYLTEWTWRAIFWVNVPVAIIALILTARAKPADDRHPSPLDWPGVFLIAGGMGLSVLGLQQSSDWGWGNPVTWACIVAGLILLAVFVLRQLRVEHPLMRVRIFEDRGFAADNAVLFLLMIVFVPLFLFASLYAQVALGEDASGAGLYLLIFFAGYWAGAQWGGRQLDKNGARSAVIPGCALAAVGFFLWGEALTDLDSGDHWIYMVMAGAGTGAILGPASTDALNRAPSTSYGEATGILQTLRNYGASLGLAVLGTILILENKSKLETSLTGMGLPPERADSIADSISQAGAGTAPTGAGGGGSAQRVLEAVQHDFAASTQVIFYVMAGVLVACYIVAHIGMPKGKPESLEASPAAGSPESSASAATGP
jgi:EmrB/QacA subfamily drug resistance transporter